MQAIQLMQGCTSPLSRARACTPSVKMDNGHSRLLGIGSRTRHQGGVEGRGPTPPTQRWLCRLSDLYALWGAPPFGVKSGVLPLLALAYFLANSRAIALYHEDVFIPHLTEVHVDEWLQDPSRITWKYFEVDSVQQEMIGGLSKSVSKLLGRTVMEVPLEFASSRVARRRSP